MGKITQEMFFSKLFFMWMYPSFITTVNNHRLFTVVINSSTHRGLPVLKISVWENKFYNPFLLKILDYSVSGAFIWNKKKKKKENLSV